MTCAIPQLSLLGYEIAAMCSELWQLASTFYKVDVTTTIRTKAWNLYCNRVEDIHTRSFSMYMKCIGVYYTSVGTIDTWSSSCHWAPAVFCHVHKCFYLQTCFATVAANIAAMSYYCCWSNMYLQQVKLFGVLQEVIVPTSKCNPRWCGFGLLQPIDTMCHCLQKVY